MRQSFPVLACAGKAMLFPTKLRGPMDAQDTWNEVLEKSALMIDNPSATIVLLPTVLWNGVSWRTSILKFDPVCTTRDRSYPKQRT